MIQIFVLLKVLRNSKLWPGFFLIRSFGSLIREFDFRKGYSTLYKEIIVLAEDSETEWEIQAIIEDVLLYAMYLANGDMIYANDMLAEMGNDLGVLCSKKPVETASIHGWMMKYLTRIGKMLAQLWLEDCGEYEIRNPKAFTKMLGCYLRKLSVDITTIMDGDIMLDSDYDFTLI